MKVYLLLKLGGLLILLLFANTSSQVAANQLVTPFLHDNAVIVESQLGNDIFFFAPPGSSVIDPEINSRGTASYFYSDGPNRYPLGTINPANPFTPLGIQGLQHLSNSSDEDNSKDNSITVTQRYHDLMNNSKKNVDGTNLLENYILLEDEFYGFRFDVNKAFDPLVLDIEISTDAFSLGLNVNLINPDGIVNNLFNNIIAETDTLIPIIPSQTGMHTLILQPTSSDMLVNQLALLNDFPVERIDNGCVKTFTGTNPRVFFYELHPSNAIEGQRGLLHVDGFVDQNVISTSTGTPTSFFGSGEIRVHGETDPFGSIVPETVLDSGNTIVSVVARPPVFTTDAFARTDIPSSYNLDIGFWGDSEPVRPLPQNEDILTSDQGSFFDIIIDTPSVVHFDDDHDSISYPSWIDFYEIGGNNFFSCNSNNCNLGPNTPTGLQILPPGEYFVAISPPFDGSIPVVQVGLFEPDALALGSGVTIDTVLNEPQLLHLPSNGYGCDLFNFSLVGENSEVEIEVKLFDSQGTSLGASTDYSFYQYTNDTAGLIFMSPSQTKSGLNLNGGFLWINQIANSLLNNSENDPLNSAKLAVDDENTLFTILIDRLDGCSAENLATDQEVFRGELTESLKDLNFTKTSILAYYTFTSNAGGNRIVLESTNFSMSAVNLLTNTGNVWISSSSVLKVINGVNHYFVELEFGTLNATLMGISIVFNKNENGNVANGTLSATIESSDYFVIPDLKLGRLKLTDTDNGRIPATLETQVSKPGEVPIGTVVVVIVAIGAIGGGAFVFNRRRSIV